MEVDFLQTSLVAQMVKRLSTMRVQSLGWENPLEKEMAIHGKILPGKSHGQRSLVDYSPWGHKESDTTERLHFLFFHFLAWKLQKCKIDPRLKSNEGESIKWKSCSVPS